MNQPVLTSLFDALHDYLVVEANAGRIVPTPKEIVEIVDWDSGQAFPCIRLSCTGEVAGKQYLEMGAQIIIRCVLGEPQKKTVQRALQQYAWSVKRAIERRMGDWEPGVKLNFRGITYRLRAREGKMPIFYADVQYAAIYHESNEA